MESPVKPGRFIQRYGPEGGWVMLDGERYNQAGLLNFVKQMRHWPRTIHLVHGDMEARSTLQVALKSLAAKKGKAMTVTLPDNLPG